MTSSRDSGDQRTAGDPDPDLQIRPVLGHGSVEGRGRGERHRRRRQRMIRAPRWHTGHRYIPIAKGLNLLQPVGLHQLVEHAKDTSRRLKPKAHQHHAAQDHRETEELDSRVAQRRAG